MHPADRINCRMIEREKIIKIQNNNETFYGFQRYSLKRGQWFLAEVLRLVCGTNDEFYSTRLGIVHGSVIKTRNKASLYRHLYSELLKKNPNRLRGH